MRKLLLAALFALCLTPAMAKSNQKQTNKNTDKIVLAYVSSGTKALPDPSVITHINYAFATVAPTFDGIVVQKPEYLKEIVALKKNHPHLKVMLSIGGWGAGGFSEMASNDTTRTAFVKHCAKINKEFKLDGIDLDWEYPGSSSSGIKSTDKDTENFTKLMGELRKALGKNNLLTLASAASARHIDFKAILPHIDFVNLMCYDMGRPHRGMHQSALYQSDKSRWSVDQSVDAHKNAGIPKNMIVVGVPFYGHANTQLGYSDYINFADIQKTFKNFEFKWDNDALVPYITDAEDNILCVYDNPRSLKEKCKYIKENDLRGIMYWEYACDDAEGTLRKTVYNEIYPNPNK